MASIINDPNGRRRIQFVAPDGSRKAVRLGKIDRKSAESVCRHVEDLLSAKMSGQTIPRNTAAWLPSIASKLRIKLAAAGLIEPAITLSVGDFLTKWLAEKAAAGFKPTSLRAWGQTTASLVCLLGTRELVSISQIDGEAFRAEMRERGLRPTTIHKRIGHARQMLEDAVRQSSIAVNPWKHVRQRAGDPSERRAYVPVSDAERVLEYCPNYLWKLLVALARFGGLRIPSEAFPLTWGDVDWERGRLSVPSPKTEHVGKPHRIIPLFPQLRAPMDVAFENAPEGSTFIFPEEMRKRAGGPLGWGGANLRTTFGKIIRKAGVEPWSRIWHSLRASFESDLAQSFPLATVTKWLGNTPSVALRHYVDPTDTAFEKAQTWMAPKSGAKNGAVEARNAAQQVPAASGDEVKQAPRTPESTDDSASPCDIPHVFANSPSKDSREWIGIEPTGGVVHAPHRF